jgi:MFS family permease
MPRCSISAAARDFNRLLHQLASGVGQVDNLLPHVVVPAVMAQHLIPLRSLTASDAGFMASAYALGYMLGLPVLTALTNRVDVRVVLLVGWALSGLATLAFGFWADGLLSADLGS